MKQVRKPFLNQRKVRPQKSSIRAKASRVKPSKIRIRKELRAFCVTYLNLKDDAERLEFEADCIQLDVMTEVREQMALRGMDKATLAKALGMLEDELTDVFTADKKLTFELLAKFQRVFQTRVHIHFNLKR